MTGKGQFLTSLVHLYQTDNAAESLSYFCRTYDVSYDEIAAFAVQLKAEGSVMEGFTPETCRLTDAGYRRYSTRVDVLNHREGRGPSDFIHPNPASHD